MANSTVSAASFRKSLARLTGDKGERCDHIFKYRIAVETADGQHYGLRLSAGINAKDPPKSDIGRLKRRLCLQENGIKVETVIEEWSSDDLLSYIKEHVTREQLDQRRGG